MKDLKTCNPEGYYCPVSGRVCDPLHDCPLARFQQKLEREQIPEQEQVILLAVYAGK